MNITNYFLLPSILTYILINNYIINPSNFYFTVYDTIYNYEYYRLFSCLLINFNLLQIIINTLYLKNIINYIQQRLYINNIFYFLIYNIVLPKLILIAITIILNIFNIHNNIIYYYFYGIDDILISLIYIYGYLYNSDINIYDVIKINSNYLYIYKIILNLFVFNVYNHSNLIFNISGLLSGLIISNIFI